MSHWRLALAQSCGDTFSYKGTKVRPSEILLEPRDHGLSFLESGPAMLGCDWTWQEAGPSSARPLPDKLRIWKAIGVALGSVQASGCLFSSIPAGCMRTP